jgi:hypothetical protein
MVVRVQKTHEVAYHELKEALDIDGEIEKVFVDFKSKKIIITTKETEDSGGKGFFG